VITRAVVLPHPPLLVPELVTGAATETAAVRAACLAAATRLADAAPDWIAVATDPTGPRRLDPDTAGSFHGYGVDVPVRLSASATAPDPDPDLPLPALVAGWLRAHAGARRVTVHLVPPDLPAADCAAFGRDLAARPDPVGLLVLGDGSTRHSDRAPERPDDRAPDFDNAVHTALATADPAALLALDPALAAELGAAGRAAWQVLAGAAQDRAWQAEADLVTTFGVGYHLAEWTPLAS
jgi:aromatic ring-opening dioxygenase LigB subunit